MLRTVSRRFLSGQSGNAMAMFCSALLRCRHTSSHVSSPKKLPRARTARSERWRAMTLVDVSAQPMTTPLRARALRFPTFEVLENGLPIAALAQQTLDRLAKRAFAAAARQLPLRGVAYLRRRVGWRGGDSGAEHRREIRQIVAEVKSLIEAKREFVQHPFTRVELVRRTLVQLLNSELARAAHEGGGAAAGQQSHA